MKNTTYLCNKKMRKDITKGLVEKIHKEYREGLITLKELNNTYGFNVRYQFKKYGLKIFGHSESFIKFREKRYGSKIIRDFSKIDKNIAYILGFIYADGYITENPTKLLGIKIKTEDEYLLEIIKEYVSSGIRIKKEKNSSLLTLSSAVLFDNLIALGVKTKKTYKSMKIPLLEEELYHHFIRGVFDGDGSVFLDEGRIKYNICSTDKSFLEKIKEILDRAGIYSTINTEKRKGKIIKIPGGTTIAKLDMHRLFIRKKEDVGRFYSYLYRDCGEFFLKRKKSIFDNSIFLK